MSLSFVNLVVWPRMTRLRTLTCKTGFGVTSDFMGSMFGLKDNASSDTIVQTDSRLNKTRNAAFVTLFGYLFMAIFFYSVICSGPACSNYLIICRLYVLYFKNDAKY